MLLLLSESMRAVQVSKLLQGIVTPEVTAAALWRLQRHLKAEDRGACSAQRLAY